LRGAYRHNLNLAYKAMFPFFFTGGTVPGALGEAIASGTRVISPELRQRPGDAAQQTMSRYT
jgi:hypothetical protein